MKFSKIKNFQSWLLAMAFIFFTVGILQVSANSNIAYEDQEQTEFRFEDEDLLKFVEANREISELRRGVNEDISELVEEEGLTMERFQQIARASQIGALDEGAFSNEEIEAFNNVAPMVTELQRERRSMTEAILAEKGLSTELYQQILQEYRQNSDMQQYVSELLRERAREQAFQKRKRELMEEKGLTEEEAEERIIRRSQAEEKEEKEEN